MTAASLAIDVLVALGVALCWLSCVGGAIVRDDLDRIHFLTPLTTLAVPVIAVAVLIQASPLSIPGAKAILITLALFCSGPILNHAIARAARIRATGDWRPDQRERAERQR